MRGTTLLRRLLLVAFAACCSALVLAQDVDPKTVAKIVQAGTVKFSSTKSMTIWLGGNQKYSVYPVTVESNESHEYLAVAHRSVNDTTTMQPAKASSSAPSDKKVSVAGASELTAFQGPRPPPPPPPPNHGGPRPPLPIPPRPSNRRPTPQPPPKPKEALASEGAIVGKLVTDGISQTNWKLEKGIYTIVLTRLKDKPVAALVSNDGKYVASFDNIFFLDASDQSQK